MKSHIKAKNLLLLIIFGWLLIVLVSCGDKQKGNKSIAWMTYYPLTVGREWEYEARFKSTQGEGKTIISRKVVKVELLGQDSTEEKNSEEGQKNTERQKPTEEQNSEEGHNFPREWFVVETSRDGKADLSEYCSVNKDGVLFHRKTAGIARVEMKPAEPLLKFPLTPDHTWEWNGQMVPVVKLPPGQPAPPGVSVFKIYKVVPEQEVETPAGKFKAVGVNVTAKPMEGDPMGSEMISLQWYAPGIGLVKEETQLTGHIQGTETRLNITTLLKSYK